MRIREAPRKRRPVLAFGYCSTAHRRPCRRRPQARIARAPPQRCLRARSAVGASRALRADGASARAPRGTSRRRAVRPRPPARLGRAASAPSAPPASASSSTAICASDFFMPRMTMNTYTSMRQPHERVRRDDVGGRRQDGAVDLGSLADAHRDPFTVNRRPPFPCAAAPQLRGASRPAPHARLQAGARTAADVNPPTAPSRPPRAGQAAPGGNAGGTGRSPPCSMPAITTATVMPMSADMPPSRSTTGWMLEGMSRVTM